MILDFLINEIQNEEIKFVEINGKQYEKEGIYQTPSCLDVFTQDENQPYIERNSGLDKPIENSEDESSLLSLLSPIKEGNAKNDDYDVKNTEEQSLI